MNRLNLLHNNLIKNNFKNKNIYNEFINAAQINFDK